MTYVREALKEQAFGFVDLAEKCLSVYCGQLAMVATIPENIDMNFLTENYRSKFWKAIHTQCIAGAKIYATRISIVA